jgi:hypothetical protein
MKLVFILCSLSLLAVAIALVLYYVLRKKKKSSVAIPAPTTPAPSNLYLSDGENEKTNQHFAFQSTPVFYIGVDSSCLVPIANCCSFSMTLQPSGLPDGSLYIKASVPNQGFLDMIRVDFSCTSAFYSIRVVPFESLKRGWRVERDGRLYKFYQDIDGERIYMGLSTDMKSINGFNTTESFMTLDLFDASTTSFS